MGRQALPRMYSRIASGNGGGGGKLAKHAQILEKRRVRACESKHDVFHSNSAAEMN